MLDQNVLNSIPYSRLNCSKTLPFTVVQTLHTLHMGVPPPEWFQDFNGRSRGAHTHPTFWVTIFE